jgi:hypothetical protein
MLCVAFTFPFSGNISCGRVFLVKYINLSDILKFEVIGLFGCDSVSWSQWFSTFRIISVPLSRPKQFDPWSWRSNVPSQHPALHTHHAVSNPRRSESGKTTLPEPQFFPYKLFLLRMRSFLGNRGFIQICKYSWNWILEKICFHTWSFRGNWVHCSLLGWWSFVL